MRLAGQSGCEGAWIVRVGVDDFTYLITIFYVLIPFGLLCQLHTSDM